MSNVFLSKLYEMYIDKIRLMNIRSYKNTELNFSKSINLLVGNNNSGKSTIIKSLFKLQNSHSIGIDDIRKIDNYGRIFIDMLDIAEKEIETFKLSLSEPVKDFPDTDKLMVAFGIYTSIIETKKKQDSYLLNLNNNIQFDNIGRFKEYDNDNNEQAFIAFNALPNTETHNNFIYPFFSKRKTGYYNNQLGSKEAYHVGEDLRNITSKVQKISNPSHPKNTLFNKHLNDILGFKVGVIPHGENQSNTGIFVNDTTVIPIDCMGEGVVNIIGLIVMLLTEDRKLYLIEELENDIHPKALKKLLELIIEKSANNQFVISTHSNIVVKYLGNESSKIFHLKWKPYDNSSEDNLPTTTIAELPNNPEEKLHLLEDLGYDIFDFDLYKSYLILEESSAETLIKDFLIPTFCPQLKDKIKTIAASGVDDVEPRFHDFLRLFVFIHQNPVYASRAWVVVDGDEVGHKTIESLKSKFKSWSSNHFLNLSKPNIEDFYPQQFQQEFAAIITEKDTHKKRDLKILFNKKVFDWINANQEQAKNEFATTASEIIGILNEINNSLQSNSSTKPN